VLAFGGSVGPEGPMVQLGALIGSGVGQRMGIRASVLKTMVRAGIAAGIGAAFRSPAGGVLSTLEVFGARLNRDLAAISVAAGLGFLTRTALLGDQHPFFISGAKPVPLIGLLTVVPLMGLAAAPAGHLFICMMNRLKTAFPARWPLSARVSLGGLLVGLLGIYFPQVMSAGYPVIRQGLD